MTDAPEQVIKIYRGDDTDWNGETLLNFTVTADFDISDFTAEFLLGGITKKNISLSDGGNFEVNFSHEETAQMPWGLNKGILKIFDADKKIKTVTNDILFWVTNEPVGEQTESIIVPVPETSPIQISLQIGGGGGGSAHWGGITGNIENQTDLQSEFATKQDVIADLDTIRSGAALGATAAQPSDLADKQDKTLATPITVDGTQQTTVEGALGAINTLAGKGIANKATGTSSLSILGGAATTTSSINIGSDTSAPTNSYATILGNNSSASGQGGISIGQYARTAGHGAIAIGHGAYVSGGTSNTRCSIAIGGSNANNPSPTDTACAVVSNAASAIQLGAGTNTTSNSFQVYSYPMLDGATGKIPTARLNSTEVSAMGMPSSRYEALTLGSSGDSYTAPGNGYYYIYIPAGSSANNQLIYIENVGKPCASTMAPGTLTGIACTLPVLSGDTVKIYYVKQAISATLRFYYADGNPGGN